MSRYFKSITLKISCCHFLFPSLWLNLEQHLRVRSTTTRTQSHAYYIHDDRDRGSSIERTEVDLRTRVHLEQPPGERLRRPRQFADHLKLARKLLSLLGIQHLVFLFL